MLVPSAFVLVAWVALVKGSLLELKPIHGGSTTGEIHDLLVPRQNKDVPPQCKPVCDPPNAKAAQGCRAADCCNVSYEQAYFDCALCVGRAVNAQDYSRVQQSTDALVTQCVKNGYPMKKLTYPGQNPDRPLVTEPPKPPTPTQTSSSTAPAKPTSEKPVPSTSTTVQHTVVTPVPRPSTGTDRGDVTPTTTSSVVSQSSSSSSSSSTSFSHTVITAATQTALPTPALLSTVAQLPTTQSTVVVEQTATQPEPSPSSGAISSFAFSHLVTLAAVCAQFAGLLF